MKNEVALNWVPGNSEIRGNKEANILARKSAQTPVTGPEPLGVVGKNN